MVHLLVLVVTVTSDDCFLVTEVGLLRLEEEGYRHGKGVSASASTSYNNNNFTFSRWFLWEGKEVLWKSKAMEFGCQFFQGYLVLRMEVWWGFIGKQKA